MISTKKLFGSMLFIALFASLSALPGSAFAKSEQGEHEHGERAERHAKTLALTAAAAASYSDEEDDEDDAAYEQHEERVALHEETHHDHDHEVVTPPTPTPTPTPSPAAAPVLSAIAAARGVSTSTISWTTDVPATGAVFFGTTTPFVLNAATSQSTSTNALSTSHSFTLSNLAASTTYIFVVRSADAAGTTTSNQYTFTTAIAPTTTTTQVTLTPAVVAQHNTQASCWSIISGNVYNLTSYLPNHPGGLSTILSACGTDATAAFTGIGHSANAVSLLAGYLLGALNQIITI